VFGCAVFEMPAVLAVTMDILAFDVADPAAG
jgi:hypothetical protein